MGLTESAQLNDEKKLKSEFFEDKVRSILGSIAFTVKVRLDYLIRKKLHITKVS